MVPGGAPCIRMHPVCFLAAASGGVGSGHAPCSIQCNAGLSCLAAPALTSLRSHRTPGMPPHHEGAERYGLVLRISPDEAPANCDCAIAGKCLYIHFTSRAATAIRRYGPVRARTCASEFSAACSLQPRTNGRTCSRLPSGRSPDARSRRACKARNGGPASLRRGMPARPAVRAPPPTPRRAAAPEPALASRQGPRGPRPVRNARSGPPRPPPVAAGCVGGATELTASDTGGSPDLRCPPCCRCRSWWSPTRSRRPPRWPSWKWSGSQPLRTPAPARTSAAA